MGEQAQKDIKPCPSCGGPIPSAEHAGEYPGALSRIDNVTEICSACGLQEARQGIKRPDSGHSFAMRQLLFQASVAQHGWRDTGLPVIFTIVDDDAAP